MLTEAAIVTRRDGRRVELELHRGSACGNCELSQGCGTGALGRLLGRRSRALFIETEQQLEPGDEVQLALSEAALVKASLALYGLPLLGMVLAGLLAASVAATEWLVVVAAVIGFYSGYRVAAFLTNRLEDGQLAPYIVNLEVNPGPDAGS
ncbi:MAG: SoxR reducing system RseC family protein [Gammaproteobacteria bacterium]|nr:SoxR reducing system RseC family protein [Gammaproteobacteria bacterium]